AGVGWPLVARAQPAERVRRLGFLDAGGETDELSRASRAALAQGLAALGWIEGRNLKTDQRFGVGDTDRMHLRSRAGGARARPAHRLRGGSNARAAGRDTDDSDRLHRRW